MAALSTTTLGQALSVDALTVYLASGAGVSTGTLLFVDKEALSVSGQLTSTAFQVQRGAAGTTAAAHASGTTVYIGTPAQFYSDDPVGVPEAYPIVTPWINLVNGNVWSVSGSAWVLATTSGAITATTVTADDVTATDAIAADTIDATTSVDTVDLTATGTVDGADFAVGGVAGDSSGGALSVITSITVVNGLVTDIQGT